LDKANDMETDLRGRVVALEQGAASNSQRLTTLEAWRTQRDIDSARHDERWKRMDDKIDAVGKKVDKISEGLSRIMWTVILALIAAAIAFVVKGGLAPP
jgi:hypothetical protein